MKLSWWPLHSTWMSNSSGFSLGWWTTENEMWFQKHLQQIRTGAQAAQPLSASNWQSILKGQKSTLRLRRRTENEAKKILGM